MTITDELLDLLKHVSEFALQNCMIPIADAIAHSQDISQLGPAVHVKVVDMHFWAVRSSHLKDRDIECPGLAEFIDKVKTADKNTSISQIIFLLDKKYYLHTYTQNTAVFAAFLTDISKIRRRGPP